MQTGATRSGELVPQSLLRQKARGWSENPGRRAVPRLSAVRRQSALYDPCPALGIFRVIC